MSVIASPALEHVMKGVERTFQHRIRQQTEVDDMQFGLMKGKETTDAIFTARRNDCKRCTSYGNSVRLSVRPSVTRWYCIKTTARSMVHFALSDSTMCLV